MPEIAAHYLEEVDRQLRGHKRMADQAIAQLSEEQFFVALDPEANSVAILVKHIAGNLHSRYTDFLTSDGEKPDRHRDQEFELPPGITRSALMQSWEQSWQLLFSALTALRPEDTMRTLTIRSEPHTVVQALNRSLAHLAQHIGQIVFLAKHLRSAEWQTLSIPRGKTDEFNARMAAKQHKPSA